jgi:membrane-bound lytic murein transglycosylase A
MIDQQAGFATRYAYFEPARWNELPGWEEDSMADAWAAFRRSCGALGRKTAWNEVCTRAIALGTIDDDAVRRFFEREFSLYAIRKLDRSPDGVITGYYEPFLNGSRRRRGAFVYPIYAAPDDMLTVDIRSVPRELRGRPLGARIEGRKVIPVLDGAAPYVLDVGELRSDVRDKKLRVRREGQRIVPYPMRAQIERDGLPHARVLAWVDNPAALYSMQIQGSGKVRLSDGQILRLAYAEQNGHPFMPPVRKTAASQRQTGITTRGLDTGLPDGERDSGDELAWREAWMMPEAAPLTRGGASFRRSGKATAAPLPGAGEPLSPEVEQLIEDLASGREIGGPRSSQSAARTQPPAAPAVATPPASAPASGQPPPSSSAAAPAAGTAAKGAGVTPPTPMNFPQPSAAMRAAISADPSYVFFREIPDGPEGPIGALGVPLTAGRSLAIDPRTTPLGFPVFVSTTRAGQEGRLNRLVMAQDTGGAIRGAVRADYFWGFGADAHAHAARMKESGRMWVLFPHGLQIAAREQAVRTRGMGAAFADVDCVVEDADLCVEDR